MIRKPFNGQKFNGLLIVSDSTDEEKQDFLNYSIDSMIKEFDTYCNATNDGKYYDGCPWCFNERAMVGLLATALARNSNNSVLQEYSCYRTLNNRRYQGRADLWVYYAKKMKRILIESKFEVLNLDAFNDDWKYYSEKDALRQAKQYAVNESFGRNTIDYIASYSFYCLETAPKIKKSEWEEPLKKWTERPPT